MSNVSCCSRASAGLDLNEGGHFFRPYLLRGHVRVDLLLRLLGHKVVILEVDVMHYFELFHSDLTQSDVFHGALEMKVLPPHLLFVLGQNF